MDYGRPMSGRERAGQLLPAATAAAIAVGAVLHAAGAPRAGDALWSGTVIVVLVPVAIAVARSLGRGDVGVDAIALLAMAGCLALGEYSPAPSSPSCSPGAPRSRRRRADARAATSRRCSARAAQARRRRSDGR